MADSPDVLFLVLDSLRKDRVFSYGYDERTTPALDTLAMESTVYENAYAPAPWTLPSHCSMFTGLTPSEHGVTNGFADGTQTLSREIPTLAERLSERGYRTAGFSNNPWVGQLPGLDRGFDEFVEWDLEISSSSTPSGLHSTRDRFYSKLHKGLGQAVRQPAFILKRRFFTSNLVDRATRWLNSKDATPTFTFLNLMEAHSPYFPPKAVFRELGFDPPNRLEPRILNTKLLAYVMGKRQLDAAERERVLQYYDASLRYQDRHVEAILTELKRRDAYDETLIVVCADHGKTLGEYDRDATPPHYVREINVNVPLLVKQPGQTDGRRETGVFECADLYNLVLDGRQAPQQPQGNPDVALVEDFLPHTGSETPETVDRWRVAAGRNYKYVRSDAGEEFVFATDSERDTLLSTPSSGLLDTYRAALDERVRSLSPESAGDGTDSRDIEGSVQSQLRDLGYM